MTVTECICTETERVYFKQNVVSKKAEMVKKFTYKNSDLMIKHSTHYQFLPNITAEFQIFKRFSIKCEKSIQSLSDPISSVNILLLSLTLHQHEPPKKCLTKLITMG